jgi:hypothetical protein
MALSFNNNQTNNRSILEVIGVVALVLFLGIGTYLLFFAKEPLVEVVAPSELESISELSNVNLEGGVLADHPVFQLLKQQVSEIIPANSGRENPFTRFQ